MLRYFLGTILSTVISTAIGQDVTYGEHIQPIIQSNCVQCHTEGGIGPMPFRNYQEVSSYGQMIQFMTSSEYMPPDRSRTPGIEYVHQNRLDEAQVNLIRQWVEGGLKKGPDVEDCVYSPKRMSDYDVEISMNKRFEQYDIYFDQFQVFVVPYDFGQDTFVSGIEFLPGAGNIVRSCQVSIALDTAVLSFDRWDPRPGYNSFGGVGFMPELSHWHSWSSPDTYWTNEKHPKAIPGKGFMLFHISYGPTSDQTFDLSSIRIKFAETDLNPQFVSPLINEYHLTIKPERLSSGERVNLHAKLKIPDDLVIHEIYPQFNLLCRSVELYAKLPGQQEAQYLLKILDWDFMWRRSYQFENPIHLPKGSEVHAFVRYDNTSSNLSLPDAQPVNIEWGDQMFGETFLFHFNYSIPGTDDKSKWIHSITLDGQSDEQLLFDWLEDAKVIDLVSWETGQRQAATLWNDLEFHQKQEGHYTIKKKSIVGNTEYRVITKVY